MSTAKSMAANYLNSKRQQMQARTMTPSRFKSSTSNLNSNSNSASTNQRLKSTSMTNLIAAPNQSSRIQRPASRNALDNIHMGMNAKYAQIQSKVLLHNIRPASSAAAQNSAAKSAQNEQPSAKSPSTAANHAFRKTNLTPTAATSVPAKGRRTPTAPVKQTNQQQQLDKNQLQARVKSLEEELAKNERLQEELRGELEREKQDKADELKAIKLELQEKIGEHERQNEDYHQKLVEAFELADQNRRAADSLLSESRQRDEEARKKIAELEQQLLELKEFVAMKEEMSGKMGELREQIREERERYEEKTRGLSQMFENEKISHMQVDQNSNYFKRVKPSLIQSVESVNRLSSSSEENLNAGPATQTRRPAQLLNSANIRSANNNSPANSNNNNYQSEQDIYGSKLSTRMQDTARSAWKLSRKFASSVITGSVGGLSACRRQCTRRRSSAASFEQQQVPNMSLPMPAANDHCREAARQAEQVQQVNSNLGEEQQQDREEQHTSVIKVGGANSSELDNEELARDQKVAAPSSAIVIQHQPAARQSSTAADQANNNLTIRVDENQKLTIVTKFNDQSAAESNGGGEDNQTTSPSSSASSSCWSPNLHSSKSGPEGEQQPPTVNCCQEERLRCESSSSGRGTSDTSSTSAASCQNGDVGGGGELADSNQEEQQTSPASNCDTQTTMTTTTTTTTRRHKRKSSLAKTKKIFSGSQASLNKLRNFFSIAAGSKASAATQLERNSLSSGSNNKDDNGQIFRQMRNQSMPSWRDSFDYQQQLEQHQDYCERTPDLPANGTTTTNNCQGQEAATVAEHDHDKRAATNVDEDKLGEHFIHKDDLVKSIEIESQGQQQVLQTSS